MTNPIDPKWVIYRQNGKVFARQTLSKQERREMYQRHGRNIVATCTSYLDAVAHRHDAQQLCCLCTNGARNKKGSGKYVCADCAADELRVNLADSVAIATAQRALREQFGGGR